MATPRSSCVFRVGRHQRPAQEHGPAGSRRRPDLDRHLRLARTRSRKTLKTFPIDLTDNPTMGRLARPGPRREGRRSKRPTPITGVMRGRRNAQERSRQGQDIVEVELLNLLTDEGCAACRWKRSAASSSLNPSSTANCARRWTVLASGHDTDKKTGEPEPSGRGQAPGARGLHPRNADLEDELSPGAERRRKRRFCKAGRSSRTRPRRTGTT